MPRIYITADTCLKQRTVDASSLSSSEKHHVSLGESYEVSAFLVEGKHIKFTLKSGTIDGRNTWYAFSGHCTIETGTIPPDQIRINSIAIALVKEFEGLKLTQYICSAGVSTIGYGSTIYIDGGDVPAGATIDLVTAEQLLRRDLKEFIASLRELVKVSTTGKQIAALTSFVYNLGAASLAESTLLRRLNNAESTEAIAAEFLRWDKAGGQQLPGLTRRRERERDLFLGL